MSDQNCQTWARAFRGCVGVRPISRLVIGFAWVVCDVDAKASANMDICSGHFDTCWNPGTGAWKPQAKCRGPLAQGCDSTLCEGVRGAECLSGVPDANLARCNSLDRLCESSVQLQQLKPAIAHRERSSDKQRQWFRARREKSKKVVTTGPKPLIFLHIPKTGGTAIEEVGAAAGLTWGQYAMKEQRVELSRHDQWHWFCQRYHVPPVMLKEVPNPYEQGDTFCMTRHPYDRAISEYTYMLSVPWGDVSNQDPDRCSARKLNSYIKGKLIEYTRAPHMKFINDCHFIPQFEYVWGNGRKWCTNVLKMEAMPSSFNDLMLSRGYSVHLDDATRINSFNDACPGMNAGMFDNDTMALLGQVYKDDFEALGYSSDLLGSDGLTPPASMQDAPTASPVAPKSTQTVVQKKSEKAKPAQGPKKALSVTVKVAPHTDPLAQAKAAPESTPATAEAPRAQVAANPQPAAASEAAHRKVLRAPPPRSLQRVLESAVEQAPPPSTPPTQREREKAPSKRERKKAPSKKPSVAALAPEAPAKPEDVKHASKKRAKRQHPKKSNMRQR